MIAMFLCAAAGCLLMAVVIGLAVRPESPGAPSYGGYRGSEPPARFVLPSFELRSYTGVRVDSEDLSGRVVLLTILDAQCTDVCPILASVIAGAIDRLIPAERDQVRAVGITGDPAEDTPVAVRQFLAKRQAIGRLDYLLGSEEQLRPLWTSLQILPSLDSSLDTVHSAPLRIYGRDGVWLATLHAGADLTEENLLHDIRTALAADNKTAG